MTGTIIFIGIILICCLFVAFGNSSAPATTSCIENENLKKYTHVLNSELRCRGMFITNGKSLIMHPREKCYYR